MISICIIQFFVYLCIPIRVLSSVGSERLLHTQEVGSSNLPGPTKKSPAKPGIFLFQYLINQDLTDGEHARDVEGTFEEVTLGGLGDGAVAMEIAVPLAELGIHEVLD